MDKDKELTYTDLFSTPMWHVKKELPKGVHKWALEYKKKNPSNTTISNIGGYHSSPSTDFYEIPYLEHIKESLYCLPKFHFNNWWINVQRKGDHNILHTHPVADLSVIWYITDNHGSLHLDSPFQHTRFKLNKELNTPNGMHITSYAGNFIIFPSDLYHGVKPHTFRSPRISISMNLTLV